MPGHVDGALVSSGRRPQDPRQRLLPSPSPTLSELPLDFARFGVIVPTAMIKNQRDLVRRHRHGLSPKAFTLYKTKPKLVYCDSRGRRHQRSRSSPRNLHRLTYSMREYPIPEAAGVQNALDSLGHPNAAQLQTGAVDGHLADRRSEKVRVLSTNSTAARRKTNDNDYRLKPAAVARQPASFSPGTSGK